MHPLDYAMQIEQEGKAFYLKQANDGGFGFRESSKD